jgi:hypothetical protein
MFAGSLVRSDFVLLPGYQCAETTGDYLCWNTVTWNLANYFGRGAVPASNGNCGITVKCRGIQTDNLGKIGMEN